MSHPPFSRLWQALLSSQEEQETEGTLARDVVDEAEATRREDEARRALAALHGLRQILAAQDAPDAAPDVTVFPEPPPDEPQN